MQDLSLVNWLLDADTPSIPYLSLRDLLHRPDTDPQSQVAQQSIMTDGPVPAIFAKQAETGHWGSEDNYYQPKYVSSHWSLMLLTELAVDSSDERFQGGVEYMLSATQDRMQDLQVNEGRGLACFWGNLLRYASHAGRLDDERVQTIIQYLIIDIQDQHCHCSHNNFHACAWGVVRALWGLSAVPLADRSPSIQSAIDQSIVFLLDSFSLIEANYPRHDDNVEPHALWFKLNFPLFYQVDILFTLGVLAELDRLDHPKLSTALDWLMSLRLKDGRWRGRSPYRSRTWRELGDSSETSRWVSLKSAYILQKAGRLELGQAV